MDEELRQAQREVMSDPSAREEMKEISKSLKEAEEHLRFQFFLQVNLNRSSPVGICGINKYKQYPSNNLKD